MSIISIFFLTFLIFDHFLEWFSHQEQGPILSCLNPVDLTRIMVLLKMDISALMGYTSAVFNHFFGSPYGIALAISVMLVWVVVPISIALQIFKRKNL